jgi:hypothetical protein
MLRWLLIVAIAWPAAADAQNAEAEALFIDGGRLMDQGKIAEACEAFEASNRIEARAGTLLRLGECREKNHQLASAWSAYKDALARAKDPKKEAFAVERIAELEHQLSTLTIQVPAAAQVEGLQLTRDGHPIDRALWNLAMPMDGGTYQLSAHAPGRREWTATVVVPETSGKIAVSVPELEVTAEPAKSPPAPEVRVTAERATWTGRRQAAIATGIGAIGAGIAGGVLGALARSDQHDAEALCTPNVPCADGSHAQALIDRAHTRALETNIAFGVAGAAAIATVALWLTGAPQAGDVAIVPTITPDGAAVAIGARF